MISVLLVDDEPRFVQAWQQLIAIQEDMRVVGAIERADTLEATVSALTPDVVVIDLGMPGRDPLDAIRALAGVRPETRCIVLSGRSETAVIRAACEAGAWGHLDKLSEPKDVLDAVRRVARGSAVFPAGVRPGSGSPPS